jgi:ElaB/YqjD/DUF883 family membrane-anchored ribosome-binding protein
MADTAAKTTKTRKTAAKPAGSPRNGNAGTGTSVATRNNRDEAKSRFNAALEEARAGAAALGAEARERVGAYGTQARSKSDDFTGTAKTKAAELARDGKSKASEALTSLSRVVDRNAPTIEENLGPKYADYARTASQKLQETATSLDQKSVEQLGEDAREMVRKSPAAAVGLAALAGFLLARLFRR